MTTFCFWWLANGDVAHLAVVTEHQRTFMSRTQSASGQSASAAVGQFPNRALCGHVALARRMRPMPELGRGVETAATMPGPLKTA